MGEYPQMIGTQNMTVVVALADLGDDLANALEQILDTYQISPRLGATEGKRALKRWRAARAEILATADG